MFTLNSRIKELGIACPKCAKAFERLSNAAYGLTRDNTPHQATIGNMELRASRINLMQCLERCGGCARFLRPGITSIPWTELND